MALMRRVKRVFGLGKSDQELWNSAADQLSEKYPELPHGHFRCFDCESEHPIDFAGNVAYTDDADGQTQAVILCADCARRDRVGGEPPP